MLYCWSYRPAQRPTFLHLLFLLAPRFADADFRQASYFYVGDTFTQQPPPFQELEKSASTTGAGAASVVEFADLPNLIKTVLGPPHCAGGSGGSNSLSEDSPYTATASGTTSHFYSPSPHFMKEQSDQEHGHKREMHNELEEGDVASSDAAADGCSLEGADTSSY